MKGLLGNSKRVLQATKNDEKIQSIKAGVRILEDFLEDFDRENRGAQNNAYLPFDIVTALDGEGRSKSSLCIEFLDTYGKKAKGRYEHLRTLYPKNDDSKSWDIVRNAKLDAIKNKIKENKVNLFNDDGSPTKEHLELISWAYSPNADKLKVYVEKLNGKSGEKRKSSSGSASSPDKKRRT